MGIMSVLIAREWIEFTELKQLLGSSDGNLSSHISGLIKLGFVEMRKRFKKNKPNTSYKITPAGRQAFEKHLNALEAIVMRGK